MTNIERFEKESCGVSGCKGGNTATFVGLFIILIVVFVIFGGK